MGRPESAGGDGTLVILPALNEEGALPDVLAELARCCPGLDVLVVDDGSTDGTAAVATGLGAAVVQLPFNLGVGGALQTGFRYAVTHGYRRAVQFDADGQHDATQIAVLLGALDEGADLVIGSRFAAGADGEGADGGAGAGGEYGVGRVRGSAMGVLRLAVRLLSGRAFSDTSSGFRAFSRPLLEYYANTYPTDYMESPEALLLACHNGFRVVEVPANMRPRAAGSPSNRHYKLAYHYLRALVAMLSHAQRRPMRDGLA